MHTHGFGRTWEGVIHRNREGMEKSYQGGYDQNVLNTGCGCKGIKYIKNI